MSDFGPLAGTYDNVRGGALRGQSIAEAVSKHAQPNSTFLELGIGTAIVAKALEDLGHIVFGVDNNEEMLGKAAERLPKQQLVCCKAAHTPFRDEQFPYVYLSWVLHVVDDPIAVMLEANRLLRADGKCVVIPGVNMHRDQLSEYVERLRVRFRPRQARQNTIEFAISTSEQAGFQLIESSATTVTEFTETPEGEVARIGAKQYSFLLNVSDEDWDGVVVPLLEDMKSSLNLSEPVTRKAQFPVLVFERIG